LENDIIGIATDSICTTKRLGCNSIELGEFSLKNSANDVFYLQNGIYRFNGLWSQRGLGKIVGKTIDHLDTFEKNGRLFMRVELMRSTQLRSGIIQDRIGDIGKIQRRIREINPNADRKRFWLGRLTSLENDQFNDSIPLSLNYFSKGEI
jgi:hypothetical protein